MKVLASAVASTHGPTCNNLRQYTRRSRLAGWKDGFSVIPNRWADVQGVEDASDNYE